MKQILKEFRKYAKLMEQRGLILSSHSGNFSLRKGEKIFIKKRGEMLLRLKEKDIVETYINSDKNKEKASVEFIVHREIYRNTNANAIIHGHTTYAIVLSFFYDKIIPIDEEGKYYYKEIPIIKVKSAFGSKELAEKLGKEMRKNSSVIVRGHGTFSIGENLESAYKRITIVEGICKIIYLKELIEKHCD